MVSSNGLSFTELPFVILLVLVRCSGFLNNGDFFFNLGGCC